MTEVPRRDTMDDAELTVLALEIMEDLQNLSMKPNIDDNDSFIFKLNNDNDDHQTYSSYTSRSDDTDYEMVYISYPTEPIFPIKIISKSTSCDSLKGILPPIPSGDSFKIPPTITKINISGNKKRGIKRWTKRQKKELYSETLSIPESNLKINSKHKDKIKMDKIKKIKKKKKTKQDRYRSDGLLEISSNDSIFGMDFNINSNISKQSVDIPHDQEMEDIVFSILNSLNTTDDDNNSTPSNRSMTENKARKTKKKKKKRKEGTKKKRKRDKMKNVKRRERASTFCMMSMGNHIEEK